MGKGVEVEKEKGQKRTERGEAPRDEGNRESQKKAKQRLYLKFQQEVFLYRQESGKKILEQRLEDVPWAADTQIGSSV